VLQMGALHPRPALLTICIPRENGPSRIAANNDVIARLS
jgi:hypothetical protein